MIDALKCKYVVTEDKENPFFRFIILMPCSMTGYYLNSAVGLCFSVVFLVSILNFGKMFWAKFQKIIVQ